MASGGKEERGLVRDGRRESDDGTEPAVPVAASQPLRGVRVVVTRPAAQAEGLCSAFEERGAQVERLPLLEVVPPPDLGPLRTAVAALPRRRWVAFTSASAVDPVADLLAEAGEGWPQGVRVAAVGRATAAALRGRDIPVDLTAASGGEDLAATMCRTDPDLPGSLVLLPQATDARPELFKGLREAGAEVSPVVAYDKRLPIDARERAEALFPPTTTLGWVTFTSPRIARTFATLINDIDSLEGGWDHRRLSLLAASIGSTTSAALLELGVEPAAEADTPGDEELVAAVQATVAHRDKSRL